MIRKAFSIVLLLLALSPVVINLCGWNIHLTCENEEHVYSIAGMKGGIRLMKERQYEAPNLPAKRSPSRPSTYKRHDLFQLGSISLYIDGFTGSHPGFNYFTFERNEPYLSALYSFITFPQILLLAFTLLIILLLNHGELSKGRKNTPAHDKQ